MSDQQNITSRPANAGRPGLVLTVFVVLGAPMAYFVWHTLSDVLAGQVHGPSVLRATGILIVLVVLLRLLARYINTF